VLDAYGAGMRVPTWVISPYAKQSPNLVDTRYEHSSILKFIEKVFGLPTLASKNSNFDSSTPTGTNYQTKGKPAPPRDGLPDSTVGNLSWSASPSRHSALADTTTDRIEQKTPPP